MGVWTSETMPAAPSLAAEPNGLADGIARLRRALRRGARVADPENPLAVAQLELLSAVAENPGTRPGQVAERLHMRPNTVTTIVNALVAQGMVSRAGADGDRRAIELTATPAGEHAVRAWHATNAGVLHAALATLPPQQRRALAAAGPALDALARAIDRLTDETEPGADLTFTQPTGGEPPRLFPGRLARVGVAELLRDRRSKDSRCALVAGPCCALVAGPCGPASDPGCAGAGIVTRYVL